MKNTATFRRDVAAAGLLTTAVLSLLSAMTAPEFPSGATERLVEIDAGGTSSVVSAFAFVLAQLPFLAAALGVGHLIRGRAPVLANIGTTFAAIGAFGHAVIGGTMLMQLEMSADEANRETYGGLVETFESSPAMVFAAMGLLGTVLGLLLLAIGLWRAQVGPRWLPLALGAFLVIEFVGAGISQWASLIASVVYLISFGTLAARVHATPAAAWAASSTRQQGTGSPSRSGSGSRWGS